MSLPISRLIKRLLAVTATGASMALALATGPAAQAGVVQAGTTASPGSQAATAVRDPASLVNPFIATVDVVTSGGSASSTGVLDITPTGTMSDYYDNTGISSDTSQSCADLDGDGYSFSADALAKAGVTAGGQVTSGGVTFTWPATCQPDNVLAAGQTIKLAAHPGATMIGFLGTSTNGATSGPVTITYTDGSTSTATLSFSDWAGTAAQGENTPASIPYRNSVTGTSQSLTISVYEMSLPLTAGKTVASVTLPYIGHSVNGIPAMHIFAIGEG